MTVKMALDATACPLDTTAPHSIADPLRGGGVRQHRRNLAQRRRHVRIPETNPLRIRPHLERAEHSGADGLRFAHILAKAEHRDVR